MILDEAAMLGKTTKDAYIIGDTAELLNEWVSEVVTFDPYDFSAWCLKFYAFVKTDV